MRQSAFANYDNRTTHERWCDAMVERAKAPQRIYSVRKPEVASVRRNNYSNLEMKNLLENLLTRQPRGGIITLVNEREVIAMYYVCDDCGIIKEFDLIEKAECFIESKGELGNDLWISSDDEDSDWGYNEDEGFDPYMGEYTWDCQTLRSSLGGNEMLYMMAQHSFDLRTQEELFLIKVGTSSDTHKREKNYKSDNPSALMIYETAGTYREEEKCHFHLMHLGEWYSGEWYKVSKKVFNKLLEDGFKDFPLRYANQNIYLKHSAKSA